MCCCCWVYKHTLIGTVSKLWLFTIRSLTLTNIYQSHQISAGSLTHSLSLPQICKAESSKTERGQVSKFVIESASDFWAPLAPASSYFQRTNNNIIFSLLALWQYFDVLSSRHAIWRYCVLLCPIVRLRFWDSLASDQLGKARNGVQRCQGNPRRQVAAIDHYWCCCHRPPKAASPRAVIESEFWIQGIDSNGLNYFWDTVSRQQVIWFWVSGHGFLSASSQLNKCSGETFSLMEKFDLNWQETPRHDSGVYTHSASVCI